MSFPVDYLFCFKIYEPPQCGPRLPELAQCRVPQQCIKDFRVTKDNVQIKAHQIIFKSQATSLFRITTIVYSVECSRTSSRTDGWTEVVFAQARHTIRDSHKLFKPKQLGPLASSNVPFETALELMTATCRTSLRL